MSESGFEADLARHAGWIRALALELVRDPNVAEDLAQDAMLVALLRPPRASAALRRWLPRVLTSLVLERRRREAQRRGREMRARDRVSDDQIDAERELDVSSDIVAAVHLLDEPYRTTVVLRYFEGLEPRRIAARQNVPVKTVNTRLTRAHAELRRRLDSVYGDRRRWVLGLAPLVALQDVGGAPHLTRKVIAAGLLTAAIATLVVLLNDDGPAPQAARNIASPLVASAPPIPTSPGLATAPLEGRTEAAREGAPPSPANEVRAPTPALRGRVVDTAGRPVAAVSVGIRSTRSFNPSDVRFYAGDPLPVVPVGDTLATAVSGTDGRFVFLTLPPALSEMSGYLLEAESDDFAAVMLSYAYAAAPETEYVVVVAPRIDLRGFVRDTGGRALGGATVTFEVPEEVFSSLRTRISGAALPRFETTSDEDGSYRLERLPRLPVAMIRARQDGHADAVRPVPDDGSGYADLELLLAPLGGDALRGIVVDARGVPVENANVTLGRDIARTDPDGRFRLPLHGVESAHVVTAAALGYLPAEFVVARPPQGQRAAWPADVTLFLEGSPLSISGQVVDETGKPLPDAELWPVDPTPFATGTDESGADYPPVSVEHFLAPRGEHWVLNLTTDDAGRFRLDGLLPRSYRLACIDRETLSRSEPVTIAAGETGVVVRCDRSGARRVRGRVLDFAGGPLAGLQVLPGVPDGRTDTPSGRYYASVTLGTPVQTDEDGVFSFQRLATADLQLVVNGSKVVSCVIELGAPGLDFDALTLRVSRRCFLRVEVHEPDGPDHFAILDSRGRVLTMQRQRGRTYSTFDWAPIENGTSEVTIVPENAHTLLLLRGKEEVDRRPLSIRPAEETVVVYP